MFEGCTSLTSVRFPASLTFIGYNVFADCPSLTRVDFEGTVSQWIILTADVKLGTPTQPHADFTVYCDDGEVVESLD